MCVNRKVPSSAEHVVLYRATQAPQCPIHTQFILILVYYYSAWLRNDSLARPSLLLASQPSERKWNVFMSNNEYISIIIFLEEFYP